MIQMKVDQQVFHHQIGTDNPHTKLLCLYSLEDNEFRLHKTITLHQEQTIIYYSLLHQRLKVARTISSINQHKKASVFQVDISCLERNDCETDQDHVLLEINSTYFQGISLKDYIARSNVGLKEPISVLPSILFPMLDLFFRLQEKSLFIPTFRNILVNTQRSEVAFNLISFAGLEVFKNNDTISTHQFKQIAAFFPSNYFQLQQLAVSSRRALLIIILGLIIGKEIDLHPKGVFGDKSITMEEFKQKIHRNKDQLAMIVNYLQKKGSFKQIEEKFGIRLRYLAEKLLVREEHASWAEVVRQLFKPMSPSYTIEIKRGEKLEKQDVRSYLWEICLIEWINTSQNDKDSLFRNKIIQIPQKQKPLAQADAEMMLISTLGIDFRILQRHHGSLALLLMSCQDQNCSNYSSRIMELVQKFSGIALRIFDPDTRNKLAKLLEKDTTSTDKLWPPLSIHADFIVQSKIKIHQDQTKQFHPSMQFATLQPRSPTLLREQHQTINLQRWNKSEDNRQGSFWKEKQQIDPNQKYLKYLQIWREPQIHKFHVESTNQIGKVITSHLYTLQQYANIFTLDEDTDQSYVEQP